MPVDRDDTSRPLSSSSSSGESEVLKHEVLRHEVLRHEVLRREVLRREVLQPTPHNTGVGVMLVASAAMFFAVASSAFILRSHQPSQHEGPSASTIQLISVDNPGSFEVLSIEIIDTDLQGEGMSNCAAPLVKPGKDNSTDIIFSICK